MATPSLERNNSNPVQEIGGSLKHRPPHYSSLDEVQHSGYILKIKDKML